MVCKISKALKKISGKDRIIIKELLLKIQKLQFQYLDIKKLKARDDIYRVRKGVFRIIFQVREDKSIRILELGKRSDNIYKYN